METAALSVYLSEKALLDRFEARAIQWAEQAGIRWIELGGELWTLVSELERKKGVESGDFGKQVALIQAPPENMGVPSAALQRLLQVPGVKRASVPTTFRVESGYALACGGPSAKAGITAMVRQQIPEWALAGYTLVNVPLALSYLTHGRSEVAKATRDLTIGTTVDVGKAAAARENAPLAAHQLSGQINAKLAEVLALVQLQTEQALLGSERANDKADYAVAQSSQALMQTEQLTQQVLELAAARPKFLKESRTSPTRTHRDRLMRVWREHYQGCCPCCEESVRAKDIEIDHWYSRTREDVTNFWPVCRPCNAKLGEPVGDGGLKREPYQKKFDAFQTMLGLPEAIQQTLGLDT
jgi:hypothetical protein